MLEKEDERVEAWKWFKDIADLQDVPWYKTEFGEDGILGMKCKSTTTVMKQKGETTVNGCGADGGIQIVGLDDSFTPACMVHDVCYTRCTDPTLWAKHLDPGYTTASRHVIVSASPKAGQRVQRSLIGWPRLVGSGMDGRRPRVVLVWRYNRGRELAVDSI